AMTHQLLTSPLLIEEGIEALARVRFGTYEGNDVRVVAMHRPLVRLVEKGELACKDFSSPVELSQALGCFGLGSREFGIQAGQSIRCCPGLRMTRGQRHHQENRPDTGSHQLLRQYGSFGRIRLLEPARPQSAVAVGCSRCRSQMAAATMNATNTAQNRPSVCVSGPWGPRAHGVCRSVQPCWMGGGSGSPVKAGGLGLQRVSRLAELGGRGDQRSEAVSGWKREVRETGCVLGLVAPLCRIEGTGPMRTGRTSGALLAFVLLALWGGAVGCKGQDHSDCEA